ncbi:hypothetical protein GGX14DRAFT_482099, partial [Mycena pura]
MRSFLTRLSPGRGSSSKRGPKDNIDGAQAQGSHLVDESVRRGHEFLRRNARKMASVTDTGTAVKDNFAQLLILESTRDWDLVAFEFHARTWNYFIGAPVGTTAAFPDDVDTTSYALKLLPVDTGIASSVLDEMLAAGHTTAEGIITVYFDYGPAHGGHTDPAVCVNVLRCFYAHARGADPALAPTKALVLATLRDGAYARGTRYYPSPDAFLYFLARLVAEHPASDLAGDARELLHARLAERTDADGDALELAMRLVALRLLGAGVVYDGGDGDGDGDGASRAPVRRLLGMQEDDGGWQTGWLCRYGHTGMRLGNRYLTSALAIEALGALALPKDSR